MAEFQSPFNDLGKRPITVHGEMQCFDCYAVVPDGLYDKVKRTLTYVCDDGHRTVLENYQL
jgi:hypothetical protein